MAGLVNADDTMHAVQVPLVSSDTLGATYLLPGSWSAFAVLLSDQSIDHMTVSICWQPCSFAGVSLRFQGCALNLAREYTLAAPDSTKTRRLKYWFPTF
ncbi:uncharacterized protein CIMG_13696 [Coccidioides immitis RS]|uniref:Uncharacterized protein n=1 Tax=Coccidioides immitis (strain RS) TaxID=246410 RepID=A0A0D8JVY7_COCIM|nr:uncharacterized protein CIMG_13696 [Coccidioides immitis RS]KJF61477.1 hypothetical protein CIMG_13696 [Coccidioides immitis RS]